MKKILFVVYQPPCGTIWVNEAFRSAFGMYGEDIEPEILFLNEASISLSETTGPSKLGLLSLKMVQRYIKKYETKVYAVKEDVEKFCIKNIDQNCAVLLIPSNLHCFFTDNSLYLGSTRTALSRTACGIFF